MNRENIITQTTSIEKYMIDCIREWLRTGATITATDLTKPVLKIEKDSCNTNLTIKWPEKSDKE